MQAAASPLAKKLPERLKQRLNQRTLNAHSPSRSSRVADRRARQLQLRQLRTATHNQRVKTSALKREMKQELQAHRVAMTSENKQEEAENRRRRQLENTVSRAAAQNEASRQHAINVSRLQEAKKENAMLRQMHAQAVAGQRRRQYNFLRTQGAALHNERVALTKDYVRMSDYFEEVEGAEEEYDFDDDEFDEQKEDYSNSDEEEGGEDDLDVTENDQDQWSSAVNIGDEESYAESFQTRGSSNGTGHGGGGNWDLGRNLLLSAYTFRFRRTTTLAFTKSLAEDYV